MGNPLQHIHGDKHRDRWEKQHQRHRNTITQIADEKGVLASDAVCKIAHWQRSDQRREAAGGYQVAEHGFVVAQAEHIEVEQQLADARGNAKKQQAQQVEPGVAGKGTHAAQVGAQDRAGFLRLGFRFDIFQPHPPWTKFLSRSTVFSKPS